MHHIMIQDELLAVLTMMVEGLDKKELNKIAERFIEEIDKSEVSHEIGSGDDWATQIIVSNGANWLSW